MKLKVYSTTEYCMSECVLEEVTTKVFATKEEATEHFKEIASCIKDAVYNNYQTVGTDDDEADAVFLEDDNWCEAWESHYASSWNWCIKLIEHEIEL